MIYSSTRACACAHEVRAHGAYARGLRAGPTREGYARGLRAQLIVSIRKEDLDLSIDSKINNLRSKLFRRF